MNTFELANFTVGSGDPFFILGPCGLENEDFAWRMARALKAGGRLVLIEYRGEDRELMIKPLHKMTEQQARKEFEAVGLEWERTEDFLPLQHFLVFKKP